MESKTVEPKECVSLQMDGVSNTTLESFALIEDRHIRYEMFLPHVDEDFIQRLLRTEGKPYELEMLRDMASRLSPGDLVLDVGANIGNHSFYLAVAAKARVIALEPNAELAHAMNRTVQHNGLERQISVHAIGAGRGAGSAHFATIRPDNLGAQRLEVGEGDIPVVAIDSVVVDAPVRMIKIDVEGMEAEVLEGASELIQRDRPLLYVEAQDEEAFRRLSRWAMMHGYTYWESFNATPTHLLCPVESVDVGAQLERLASREVVQEYRYKAQLRRSQRYQRAAEARASELEAELGRLRAEHAETAALASSLRRSLLARQSKLSAMLHATREFEERSKTAEAEAESLENQVAELQKEVADFELVELQRQGERNRLARQVRHLRRHVVTAEARVNEIEDSTAFKLGAAVVQSALSWRGLLRFPVSIARLGVRGIRRRLAARNSRRQDRAPNETSLPSKAEAPLDFLPLVQQWIGRTPRSRDALSILYADINVNVVDGSSVWLSSMASILCARGPCVLVSKVPVHRDVILSNVRDRRNLIVMEPTTVLGMDALDVPTAVRLVQTLDALLPQIQALVVRGLDPANQLLQDRRFHDRAAVYLTDFFSIKDGRRETSTEQASRLRNCLTHAGKVLVQTSQIAEEMRALIGRDFDALRVPPVIPDGMKRVTPRESAEGDAIKIGYAGKINSRWGVLELLDWAQLLISEGVSVELHIAAAKISNGPDPGYENLREVIVERMEAIGAKHYTDLNRQAAMDLMAKMDFVWCYRPPLLEENTLELSTKLVEMVALEARCLCYPNEINKEALGADYPYFVRDLSQLRQLLEKPAWGRVAASTAAKLREQHELVRVASLVHDGVFSAETTESETASRTVVFAGHDLKFIDAYMSRLKGRGIRVLRDTWEWGAARSAEAPIPFRDAADVVFCEWGLANAAWYSKNLKPGQRLIVRVHAQEVRDRARRFCAEIDVSAVDTFIFVSEKIRDQALQLWGWPIEKTMIVPNYVLDSEFLPAQREQSSKIVLGMAGFVPQLKRLDRAIDLLEALLAKGVDATLRLKGHRPERLQYMRHRESQLEYYREQYRRIEEDAELKQRIAFDPWGNDMAEWYAGIDVILSCSDSESFHYAVAEGVLTGCYPVVWPREGAADIFAPDWIIDDVRAGVRCIEGLWDMPTEGRANLARTNRDLIVERYGSTRVFASLDLLLFR